MSVRQSLRLGNKQDIVQNYQHFCKTGQKNKIQETKAKPRKMSEVNTKPTGEEIPSSPHGETDGEMVITSPPLDPNTLNERKIKAMEQKALEEEAKLLSQAVEVEAAERQNLLLQKRIEELNQARRKAKNAEPPSPNPVATA